MPTRPAKSAWASLTLSPPYNLFYFFSPSAAFSSEAVVLQVTVPTIAGSQPFDPPVADPVPVIRKQLCFDSVVAWRCTSNASDL